MDCISMLVNIQNTLSYIDLSSYKNFLYLDSKSAPKRCIISKSKCF